MLLHHSSVTPYERAYAYAALDLDRTLTLANIFNDVIAAMARAFPVDNLVNGGLCGGYGPLRHVMRHGGLSMDEATRYLLDLVKKEAAKLDLYAEESMVCRAQRSIDVARDMVCRWPD